MHYNTYITCFSILLYAHGFIPAPNSRKYAISLQNFVGREDVGNQHVSSLPSMFSVHSKAMQLNNFDNGV